MKLKHLAILSIPITSIALVACSQKASELYQENFLEEHENVDLDKAFEISMKIFRRYIPHWNLYPSVYFKFNDIRLSAIAFRNYIEQAMIQKLNNKSFEFPIIKKLTIYSLRA
ncbi:hypothetical protein ACW95P_04245 [Candidatus Mycoplasma pogonae]